MKYLVPLLLTTAVVAVVIGLALHQARLDAQVVVVGPDTPTGQPEVPVTTEEVAG